MPTPPWTSKAAKALRRAPRVVSRKKRHSRRQRKAKLRVARLHARIANQRRDFSHKLSRSLVDRFTHIAFENLNVAGMARGMLVQHVTFKAANAGGVVVLVDPRGT
ncbi:transposase [Acidiphilium sp. JA12-A1]|uniref:transposase n=1 Tax=Acidiphilium sp. JA12-A1 TaxID=1464546 RepID=UPI0004611ECE|nr:transposase [Acidiphilium sp. JA12-A1]KDM68707.1 transposase [Acidiphilium sp. JA12-A1]